MKKITTILLCFVTVLFLENCQQDTSLAPADKGYIQVRLTADDDASTRAVRDVADIETWYAVVSDGTETLYDQQIGSELGTRAFNPGTYSIGVRNYNDINAANAAKAGWGDAYYEGSTNDIEVSAGGTAYVHVACGRALNAKFRLDYSEFSGIINALAITAPKTLTFAYNEGTLANEAFFSPRSSLTYTITYTIGDETKTTEPATLTLGDAATVSILKIKSDIYGIVTVSLTCDNEFEGGAESDITIDATSGT